MESLQVAIQFERMDIAVAAAIVVGLKIVVVDIAATHLVRQ